MNSTTVIKGFNPTFPWFTNIDGYIPRKAILAHLQNSLSHFSGILLDVGCGYMPYRNFIENNSSIKEYWGMDLEVATTYKSMKPEVVWDGYKIPLADGSVDTVMLTEVLEHCPYPDIVMMEVSRVLKKDGKIIVTVPFIFYLHETPFDFYRYTPYALKKLFNDANLDFIELAAYGCSTRAFLHSYFIWLKRNSLPKLIRFSIYLLTLPMILLMLFFSNKKDITEFKDSQIFTGLKGIGIKR